MKKLFIFREVLKNYKDGLAGTIATSKENAILQLVAGYRSDQELWQKRYKYESSLLEIDWRTDPLVCKEIARKVDAKYAVPKNIAGGLSAEEFMKELETSSVDVYELDESAYFYIDGDQG